MADFIILDGLPVTLFNMGTLGIAATAYILLTGGTINGATSGGILTIIGFGAFGKHLRNILPIMGGVYLGSLVKTWNVNDPSVQLGALFGTSLAPISGQFGWQYGVLVGFCIRRWCSIQVFCTEDLTCITTDFPQASLR